MKSGKEKTKFTYLRQLYHTFPVGTYLCIYKFLESQEKYTWSPLQWSPLGRRKEMGWQWVAKRDVSFICNVLFFIKENVFMFRLCH